MRLVHLLISACLPVVACSEPRDRNASASRVDPAPAAELSALGRRLTDQEVTPSAAAAAREILREHGGAPIGTEIPFEAGGTRYIARIEQHYAPPGQAGRPSGFHKGVTLYEPELR